MRTVKHAKVLVFVVCGYLSSIAAATQRNGSPASSVPVPTVEAAALLSPAVESRASDAPRSPAPAVAPVREELQPAFTPTPFGKLRHDLGFFSVTVFSAVTLVLVLAGLMAWVRVQKMREQTLQNAIAQGHLPAQLSQTFNNRMDLHRAILWSAAGLGVALALVATPSLRLYAPFAAFPTVLGFGYFLVYRTSGTDKKASARRRPGAPGAASTVATGSHASEKTGSHASEKTGTTRTRRSKAAG